MKQVPQHLSMVAKMQKYETFARLGKAADLGINRGWMGGRSQGGRSTTPFNHMVPEGHTITHFGDTDRSLGTYFESFPAENVGKAAEIGMVDRNLHPQQFSQHRSQA